MSKDGKIDAGESKNQLNWNEFDRGVFLINCLAVIYKDGKILIGKREDDKYIKNLSWCFPGGRPSYEDELEDYLKLEVKKKTNLDIVVKEIIFAKTYPEDRQFLSIYYLTEVVGGEEWAGEKFVELKWVEPKDIKKYFTTSIHPELYKKIMGYEK